MKNRGSVFRHVLGSVFVLFAGSVFSTPSCALTTSFTVDQLNSFLQGYQYSADPRKQMLAQDLQQKLAANGISLTPAGMTISGTNTTPADPVPEGCSTTTLKGAETTNWSATLDGSTTGIHFQYMPGYVSLNATSSGSLSGSSNGSIGEYAGSNIDNMFFSYHKCVRVASVSYTINTSANYNMYFLIGLDVSLVPYQDPVSNSKNYKVVIGTRPLISARASIGSTSASVSGLGIFNSWASTLAQGATSLASVYLNASVIPAAIDSKTAELRAKLPSPIEYSLPADFSADLNNLLVSALNTPFLHDYIQQHKQELLFYMLIQDKQAILQSFASSAACNSVGSLRSTAGIRSFSLFTKAGSSCVAADPEGADTGAYFTDSGCTSSIDFQPSSLSTWCTEVLGANFTTTLGNAAAWTPNANPPIPNVISQKWTLPQGTQMPITSEPIAGNTTPFMKRIDYRDISWKRSPSNPLMYDAVCKLEMRVYKKDVNATNLIPLMAIHGGSWQYRGAGFVGMEAQISHYTDNGFVVFAPFYRLAGTADGNAECNGAASTDITSDVEAALAWVQSNGAAFGARPGKISLMGQSAGAHLAGYLVTHHPNDVERALLLYPPTDVSDFLAHARPGDIYAGFEKSLNILAAYFGKSGSDPSTASQYLSGLPQPDVNNNSYRDLVASANGQMPPVFLIHGHADTLVPSNQSVILCNAYGGNATNTGGGTALRATYTCGQNGRLHLFEEAKHALDACATTRVNGMCLAGSEASRSLVASSLKQARNWLRGDEFGWLVPITNLILE